MSTVYKPITTRIDTTANWTTLNPVPAYGQQCIEVLGGGLFKLKIGDGVTPWIALTYYQSTLEGGVADLITPSKTTLVSAINSVQEQITEMKENIKHIILRKSLWDEENKQKVYVPGVTDDNAVFICPNADDTESYAENGIMCVGQEEDYLTFSCATIPEQSIIKVNVFLFE